MRIFKIAASVSFLLILFGCASGSSIVTGQTRPAVNPNEVKLFLEPPSKYETIGIVEAGSTVELSSQAAQDRAVQELKAQAAKIGANGVVLGDSKSQIFVTGAYNVSSERKTVKGKAIFVIEE